MNPIVIDRIIITPAHLAWTVGVLVFVLLVIALFRYVKNRKSVLNITDASAFQLLTAEQVAGSAGASTKGLSRAHAFEFLAQQLPAGGDLVTGVTTTPPGSLSDWHYHPNWATIAYVLQGKIRVDFGPGGNTSVEGNPGDFLFVPAGGGVNIHREQNIGAGEQILIVFRVGKGVVATTVDSHAPL